MSKQTASGFDRTQAPLSAGFSSSCGLVHEQQRKAGGEGGGGGTRLYTQLPSTKFTACNADGGNVLRQSEGGKKEIVSFSSVVKVSHISEHLKRTRSGCFPVTH